MEVSVVDRSNQTSSKFRNRSQNDEIYKAINLKYKVLRYGSVKNITITSNLYFDHLFCFAFQL